MFDLLSEPHEEQLANRNGWTEIKAMLLNEVLVLLYYAEPGSEAPLILSLLSYVQVNTDLQRAPTGSEPVLLVALQQLYECGLQD